MSRKYDEPAIGIELGPNNSRVAVWQRQNNKAEIMHNEQGYRTTPSFVAFTDHRMLIGDAAKSQAASNPSNTIFDATKLIGRKYSDPIIQNNLQLWPFKVISGTNDKPVILVKYKNEEKRFFAEEISSMVLKKMQEIAEKFLESPVKNAVITIPACFNYSQRKATKDAGVLAGINVTQIINEPTAAALAYSLNDRTNCVKNINILILDLGGRTFDVSLITLKDDKFEIKAMVESHFGGDDFDQRMVKHFVKVFKMKHKKDISGNSRALRRLTTGCERAKRTLSYDTEVIIDIDVICEGIDFCSSITRAKFEQLNMDLFEKCIETVESCLADANMYKSSVDVVVPVGGSSKIPKLYNRLRDFFGNDIIVNNHAEAVACGAAILAALLSGDLKVPNDVHQYLTRLSLAEPVQGDKLNDKKFHVTIEDDKSNVLIDFQEGVGMTVNVPGSFNISVPHVPRGLPFNVCFGADSDGMLNIFAEVQAVSKDIVITNENVRVELRNPR